MADFCYAESGVEIRLPWQLLNFSNPSEMMIHDDYYEHYGVEYIHIDEMYVGFATEKARRKGASPWASWSLRAGAKR